MKLIHQTLHSTADGLARILMLEPIDFVEYRHAVSVKSVSIIWLNDIAYTGGLIRKELFFTGETVLQLAIKRRFQA